MSQNQKNGSTQSFLTRIKIPHVYVFLVGILGFITACSYLIPAGKFEKITVNGRSVVDPTSFHFIEQTPITFMQFAKSIPAGMAGAVDIMMLVVLCFASFEIVNATGAIEGGIYWIIRRLKGKEHWIIVGSTILFSAIGAFLGWAEALLVFIPIIVSMTLALGYDAMLGVGIVLLGSAAGFTSGVLNIYTTGICQAIAGLPLFSGMDFRIISYIIFTIAVVLFLSNYAKKIQKNPKDSLIYGLEGIPEAPKEEDIPDFSLRRQLIILIVTIGFILVAYGTLNLKWYLREITGVFIIIGMVAGIVGGLSADEMSKRFAKGSQAIIPAALTIGIARASLVLLEQSNMLDTIVFYLSEALKGLPPEVSAAGILLTSTVLDFFVTSASGKAVTMMPILVPLADIIQLQRQVVVLAFQFGDGFVNYFWPTSGLLMAGLAMGGNIPWERWAKWTFKLFLTWTVLAIILVVIAQMINLQ